MAYRITDAEKAKLQPLLPAFRAATLSRTDGYAHQTYLVQRSEALSGLTVHELILLADDLNGCFGGRCEKVGTDRILVTVYID